MKKQGAWTQFSLGWNPTSATHCCVPLGTPLDFSELQALHL